VDLKSQVGCSAPQSICPEPRAADSGVKIDGGKGETFCFALIWGKSIPLYELSARRQRVPRVFPSTRQGLEVALGWARRRR
jgi:hypothetical protein